MVPPDFKQPVFLSQIRFVLHILHSTDRKNICILEHKKKFGLLTSIYCQCASLYRVLKLIPTALYLHVICLCILGTEKVLHFKTE